MQLDAAVDAIILRLEEPPENSHRSVLINHRSAIPYRQLEGTSCNFNPHYFKRCSIRRWSWSSPKLLELLMLKLRSCSYESSYPMQWLCEVAKSNWLNWFGDKQAFTPAIRFDKHSNFNWLKKFASTFEVRTNWWTSRSMLYDALWCFIEHTHFSASESCRIFTTVSAVVFAIEHASSMEHIHSNIFSTIDCQMMHSKSLKPSSKGCLNLHFLTFTLSSTLRKLVGAR